MASIDTNRGAKRAREARRELGLHPVEPLPCLLTVVEERLRLPVVVARLADDLAGACYRDAGSAILWVNGEHPRTRQRFTLAHEVGHVWCEHDGASEVESIRTISGRTTNPLEIQANAFAGEFLIPRAAALELFDGREPNLDEVVLLAAAYGVSAFAALIRLEGADLVSEARGRRLRAEIEEGEHLAALRRLAPQEVGDRLAAIEGLPYLSPSLDGSLLAAVLRGDVPAGPLGPAIAAIGASAR